MSSPRGVTTIRPSSPGTRWTASTQGAARQARYGSVIQGRRQSVGAQPPQAAQAVEPVDPAPAGGLVERCFHLYCEGHSGLDCHGFARLCKCSGYFDERTSAIDPDSVFAEVVPNGNSGGGRMDLQQFREGLKLLLERRKGSPTLSAKKSPGTPSTASEQGEGENDLPTAYSAGSSGNLPEMQSESEQSDDQDVGVLQSSTAYNAHAFEGASAAQARPPVYNAKCGGC